MHFRTHVKEELRGISGQDEYSDGMVEHDRHVGMLLAKLDELGIADNTIVFYSTDNGPHYNTWPDAAATPFRGEKNTNWEGGWRVPAMVRWPGKIEPGSVSNEIMHHMDWTPTFLAAAGEPDVKQKLLKGHRAAGRKFKVHLDGYDFLPHLTGQEEKGPRDEIFYFSDDGDLTALRYRDWKLIFLEQRVEATFQAWMEPFVALRIPLILNLRRDPYERAPVTSNTYYDWLLDRAFLLVPAQAYVGKLPGDLQGFPAAAEGRELRPRSGDGAAGPAGRLIHADETRTPRRVGAAPAADGCVCRQLHSPGAGRGPERSATADRADYRRSAAR
jgi:arylsulfatase